MTTGQKMKDMRSELLNSAERQIRTRGYEGFSFREIAKEVGIKSSSVHYYFPTKSDLGAAVARRYTDRFFASLPAAPKDSAKALHDAFAQALKRDELTCLCGVLGSVSRSLPTPVSVEAKRFFEMGMNYLLGESRKKSASRQTKEWAFQILAQLEGGMMLALAMGESASFLSIARSLPE